MCVSASFFGGPASDSMSITPGIAATTAPTIPNRIVQKLIVAQCVAPAPSTNARSHTNDTMKQPMGNGTSIGCIGCPAIRAGVRIRYHRRVPINFSSFARGFGRFAAHKVHAEANAVAEVEYAARKRDEIIHMYSFA